MDPCDVGYDELRSGWCILTDQWEKTCDVWDDSMRRRFDRDYMRQLQEVTPTMMRQMSQMADRIRLVRSKLD